MTGLKTHRDRVSLKDALQLIGWVYVPAGRIQGERKLIRHTC
jgi:hypothetical protein